MNAPITNRKAVRNTATMVALGLERPRDAWFTLSEIAESSGLNISALDDRLFEDLHRFSQGTLAIPNGDCGLLDFLNSGMERVDFLRNEHSHRALRTAVLLTSLLPRNDQVKADAEAIAAITLFVYRSRAAAARDGLHLPDENLDSLFALAVVERAMVIGSTLVWPTLHSSATHDFRMAITESLFQSVAEALFEEADRPIEVDAEPDGFAADLNMSFLAQGIFDDGGEGERQLLRHHYAFDRVAESLGTATESLAQLWSPNQNSAQERFIESVLWSAIRDVGLSGYGQNIHQAMSHSPTFETALFKSLQTFISGQPNKSALTMLHSFVATSYNDDIALALRVKLTSEQNLVADALEAFVISNGGYSPDSFIDAAAQVVVAFDWGMQILLHQVPQLVSVFDSSEAMLTMLHCVDGFSRTVQNPQGLLA